MITSISLRRVVFAACALAALAGLTTPPPAAEAGEYPIFACSVPGREAADQGPWVAYATGDPAFAGMPAKACGADGTFGRDDAASMWDAYPHASGFAGFRAAVPNDSAIAIRRIQVSGSISYDLIDGTVGSLVTQIVPSEVTICGGPQTCDGTWQQSWPAGTKFVNLGTICAGGGECLTGRTYKQQWRWIILTAAESEKPTASATGGSLLAAGDQRGTRRLAYSAGDADSGVARVRVQFGDQTVGEHRIDQDATRCTHRSWAACPTSVTGEVDVDTTAVADGRHTVTLAATDAAGNEQTAVAGVVTVDNVLVPTLVEAPRVGGSPLVGEVLTGDAGRWAGTGTAEPLLRWKRCGANGCAAIPGATGSSYRLGADDIGHRIVLEAIAANRIGETAGAESVPTAAVTVRPVAPADPAPAAATRATPATPNGIGATSRARLIARFAQGKAERRIRYGSAATVSGSLVDEHDRPISGATVVVTERVRRTGASARTVGTVRTDARGAFTYRIGRGPSRELSFGYRALATDRDFASTTKVTVLVRASVSLKTTPSTLRNGQRVRFTGVVRGRPTARTGPLVDLQVVVHGKWRSFLRGAVRADRNGRFKASYRFLRTRSAQTYRFRAVARQDSAYPYLSGTSVSRKVRVRP